MFSYQFMDTVASVPGEQILTFRICLFPQILRWLFAQFFDESKKSHCFLVCSGFPCFKDKNDNFETFYTLELKLEATFEYILSIHFSLSNHPFLEHFLSFSVNFK